MGFKDMLKYYRMREGLSQKALATRLGLSASTISMYEVGEREPDFETEEKIADFFNVDLNTLRGKDIEAPAFSPSPSPDLDPDDQELLSKYHMLSDEGKGMLQDRADELIALGKTVEEEAKKDRKVSG